MVQMIILINNPPFIFLKRKKPLKIIPKKAIIDLLEAYPISTKVLGLSTIIPAFLNPIKAIKRPTPTLIEYLKFIGIALRIYF